MHGQSVCPFVRMASLCCACAVAAMAADADWPTWRHDANRSAASPAALPESMHLQWKRELPAPRPAFARDLRLCFDLSYEPVAMGNTLFVPSMVTDSVAALDADTGAVKWTAYADGPVRFAPVAWQGKVYFVSDDGCLYCLRATDGALLWKFSGIPAGREGYRFIGDDRLISRWPARGGPVLVDGIIYFASGVWPCEGVFVHAVDAQTGKQVWRNASASYIELGLVDHGTRRNIGLSPQGYLAAVGGRLMVPSGRSLPACFDPKSGKMEPYTTGWGGRDGLAKGSWYVAGLGDYLFQSGDVYGLRPLGELLPGVPEPKEWCTLAEFAKLADVPMDTVTEWVEQKRLYSEDRGGQRMIRTTKHKPTTYISWWMGAGRPGEKHRVEAYPRLQIDPANDKWLRVFREPVLAPGAIYYSWPVENPKRRSPASYDRIVAHNTSRAAWGLSCEDGWGSPKRFVLFKHLRFPKLWALPSELKVHIKAGPRLYAGGHGLVAGVNIPDAGGQPKVSWQAHIDGTPSRMLAANGKLFVVTQEGPIYCFGPASGQPLTHPASKPTPPAPADAWPARAKAILDLCGAQQGYCLALGLGTGRLVDELVRGSELHVVVLEPDAGKIDAARLRLHARGLYGTRVHIVPGSLGSLRLPPDMARLTVTEDPSGQGIEAGAAFVEKLFHSMRPYGGAACLALSEEQHGLFVRWVEEKELPRATVKRERGLTLLTRTGALPGSGDWPHRAGAAGNTFASEDRCVMPPFGVLWFGGELDRLLCAGPPPIVSAGRLFVSLGDVIHGFDIYTGQLLWRRSFGGKRKTYDDFAAAPDGLYAACGSSCLRLDPATGATVKDVLSPGSPKKPRKWESVRVWQDYLIGVSGRHAFCMDRHDGRLLWKFSSKQDRANVAVGRGKAFHVGYWRPGRQRRGEENLDESTLYALDLRDGKVLWQTSANTPVEVVGKKDRTKPRPLHPELAYQEASDVLVLTANRSTVAAYSGTSGQVLWAKKIPCQAPPANWRGYDPPIVLRDVLVTQAGELYDLRTGARAPRRLWRGMNANSMAGGNRGCGRAIAAPSLITVRDGHVSYYLLDSGRHGYIRGVRSGCTNSLIPAGGIVNAPCFAHQCTCNWPIYVSFALVHMPQAAAWDTKPSAEARKPK